MSGLPFGSRLVLGLARILLTLLHPLLVARFVRKLGYLPNPAAPVSYHEKILWRKIIDHNPLFVILTDKLAAKERVQVLAPELRLPETLWIGQDARKIPIRLLQTAAVVKVNFGCNMNLFVANGQPDVTEIERQAKRWLAKRHGRRDREWAYSLVQPRLFVEEKLTLGGHLLPTEIKVHVCAGQVCHVWVEERGAKLSLLLDPNGTPLAGRDSDYPREDQAFPANARLAGYVREAAAMAIKIAGDLDYIRIDFLVTESGLYGGESTVYPTSGYGTWSNPVIAENFERLWDIRQSRYLRKRHRGPSRIYAQALFAKTTIERNAGH